MDPRQACAFDPMVKHASDFSKLRSLDLFPALGLAASDFWALFSRCKACHNLMTTRTIPYHVCQAGESLARRIWDTVLNSRLRVLTGAKMGAKRCADISPPMYHFLRMLDCHDVGREAGVSEDIFRSIFHACSQCGRYMTERMSSHHNEGEEEEELGSDVELAAKLECIYLRTGLDLDAG